MCGVMADMQIIAQIMKNLMPKVSEILEEKEENCGDFIGNNLINQGLNNLFTNDMLDNDTSLLIWDLLFLEGNFILIKGYSVMFINSSIFTLLFKFNKDIFVLLLILKSFKVFLFFIDSILFSLLS